MGVVVLVVLVWLYRCRACVVTEHPEDTVAEIGETATLRCTTDSVCEKNRCWFYWQRERNNEFESVSVCTNVYPKFPERYSVSSGPDWSLTITEVQKSDASRYRCTVYSSDLLSSQDSPPATLIIPSLIDVSVQPPRHPITTGDNATFQCNIQSHCGALPSLNVKWFVNETNVESFQDQSSYHLDNDEFTLTFLKISVNHTNVYCKVFGRTKSVKTSDNYLIIIYLEKKQITSATQVPETEEPQPIPSSTHSLNMVPFHSKTPTERHLPNVTVEGAHQSPSIHPSTNNPYLNIQDSSLDDNITFIMVGGAIASVFLMLVISFLIYCLVLKRKSKATYNTRSESTPQDDGGESDAEGISETQLHGDTPWCDQGNDHTSSAGERSVESPRETVNVVVASDFHQKAETKHDQDNMDKHQSTETDVSVEDGEKRKDKQKQLESMYAVVDKSQAKSKKVCTISTVASSTKVARSGKDVSKLILEVDVAQTLASYSEHETPSERQKSTVATKDLPVPGRNVDRQPSGQKPPRVIPYHLSKRRASITTKAQAAPEQTANRGEDGLVKDDPIQRNVEGLIYADLDLSRGSARIINPEEETVYADIGNKKTMDRLWEGTTGHAP